MMESGRQRKLERGSWEGQDVCSMARAGLLGKRSVKQDEGEVGGEPRRDPG